MRLLLGSVGVAAVLVLTAADVAFDSPQADSGMFTQPAPEGRPCTRAEYQTIIWSGGRSYRCTYLPDPRTFEWQPAAPTPPERPLTWRE